MQSLADVTSEELFFYHEVPTAAICVPIGVASGVIAIGCLFASCASETPEDFAALRLSLTWVPDDWSLVGLG